MATTSTVPAVKAALRTLILAALPSAQVSYGRPQNGQKLRAGVYLADVAGDLDIPVMKAGRRTRSEAYTVDVVAAAARPRGTVEEAEADAYALMAAVEDVVANDFTLGLAYIEHATFKGTFTCQSGYSNEGPICLLVEPVRVVARLT